jgi:phenylpyruvate tautomerase PptA (4-oxalocrotonate tautomerase family)
MPRPVCGFGNLGTLYERLLKAKAKGGHPWPPSFIPHLGRHMIRIYGIREKLNPIKGELSEVINACMVEALHFPANKRAHRFIPLSSEDFYYPEGRSEAYTVIEIHLMEGRSIAAKKKLIHLLFERIEARIGIRPVDVEIAITESPACNWGFRGMTGDEVKLDYQVNV